VAIPKQSTPAVAWVSGCIDSASGNDDAHAAGLVVERLHGVLPHGLLVTAFGANP
jgi:hypothetical protein